MPAAWWFGQVGPFFAGWLTYCPVSPMILIRYALTWSLECFSSLCLGPGWSRKRTMFHVDNEAVVHILNSRMSPDPNIMHFLRCLLKVAAKGQEVSNPHSSSALSQASHSRLEARCFSFMYQGLASSTRRTYSCAQENIMSGYLSPYGSPCPAPEWTPFAFLLLRDWSSMGDGGGGGGANGGGWVTRFSALTKGWVIKFWASKRGWVIIFMIQWFYDFTCLKMNYLLK